MAKGAKEEQKFAAPISSWWPNEMMNKITKGPSPSNFQKFLRSCFVLLVLLLLLSFSSSPSSSHTHTYVHPHTTGT